MPRLDIETATTIVRQTIVRRVSAVKQLDGMVRVIAFRPDTVTAALQQALDELRTLVRASVVDEQNARRRLLGARCRAEIEARAKVVR